MIFFFLGILEIFFYFLLDAPIVCKLFSIHIQSGSLDKFTFVGYHTGIISNCDLSQKQVVDIDEMADYEMGAVEDDMDEDFLEKRMGHSESDDDDYGRSVWLIQILFSLCKPYNSFV